MVWYLVGHAALLTTNTTSVSQRFGNDLPKRGLQFISLHRPTYIGVAWKLGARLVFMKNRSLPHFSKITYGKSAGHGRAGLYRFLRDYGKWDGDPTHGPTENADVCRNFFEEFLVLGDPALPIPQPERFTVKVDQDEIAACYPPDDKVGFVVDVKGFAGFDDEVVLTVNGVPAGATANFLNNNLIPPFISRLEIDDLDSVSSGRYELEVIGTSNSGLPDEMVKTSLITLGVSGNMPGTPVLLSPIDNATNVSRNPTLEWNPATEAFDYKVQVAENPGFTGIVYENEVSDSEDTVVETLQSDTRYYWRIEAANGCGTSGFSTTRSFTTIDQPDYFTQQFTSGFDLDNTTVSFVPDGGGSYYLACTTPIVELPCDPTGATALTLGEDGSSQVTLTGGIEVEFYGVKYGSFYICENGFITFGQSDGDWDETLSEHFQIPRIAPLYDDMSIPNGGTVSWMQLSDKVVVTWDGLPEYQTVGSNTYQVEMFFNGEIHLSWNGVTCNDAIIGLSAGNGIPGDYLASDLSAYPSCSQDPTFMVSVNPGTQDTCAGGAVNYEVSVTPLAGFDETVTLSAVGLPGSATAVFTLNDLQSPFNSIMTISNTGLLASGSYGFQIVGTSSGGEEKSVNAMLVVTADVPGVATLLSPADEALDVPRTPTFSWNASMEATGYTVEVAMDDLFEEIVYTRVTTDTTTVSGKILDGSTTFYWRVRAENGCGFSDNSAVRSFTTGNALIPTSYDMVNGQSGSYSYYDDTYDGSGDPTVALSPLSGGLGELTDGIIATEHWNETSSPYVGWNTVDPTITFHFAEPMFFDRVTIYVDDSGGGGGVVPPTEVTVTIGGSTQAFPVTDPPGDAPFAFNCTGLNMSGDTVEVTIADYSASSYMMLSEVEFSGVNLGACCDGESCSMMTRDACQGAGFVYLGGGASCDPNPCANYEPGCVIISEVVQGKESGNCPRWLEITNTGTSVFAFLEGGLIIQEGSSTDTDVDVDLSGVVIQPGGSFVLVSNFGGACTGSYSVYPNDPDMFTDVRFGYGDERLMLTNKADGSSVMDIYGEFGVDGTGEPWEFTGGYSYRDPAWNSGTGTVFIPSQWEFGGVDSLDGSNPTQLLLDYTSPQTHDYNEPCSIDLVGDIDGDDDVDLDDFAVFVDCITGANHSTPGISCIHGAFGKADIDDDSDVDLKDFAIFQGVFNQ